MIERTSTEEAKGADIVLMTIAKTTERNGAVTAGGTQTETPIVAMATGAENGATRGRRRLSDLGAGRPATMTRHHSLRKKRTGSKNLQGH